MRHTRTAHDRPARRSGFTLIEMLVVMALIILITALAVAVGFSGVVGSQKVVSGADRASGWLFISKVRALRDGAPRGVRFLINPQDHPIAEERGHVTTAQAIESPDPWVPNPDQELAPNDARIVFWQTKDDNNRVISSRVFFISGDTADVSDFDQLIQRNDLLVLPEFDTAYRITNDDPNDPTDPPLHFQAPPDVVASGFSVGRDNFPPGSAGLMNPRIRELRLTPLPPPTGAPGARVPSPPGPNTPLPTFDPHLGAGFSPPPAGPGGAPTATLTTYKFSFQPSPQPLPGEPTLQLTGGTIIDYRPGNLAFGQPVNSDGYRDWSTPYLPPPPAAQVLNPAPHWPSTTLGIGPTDIKQHPGSPAGEGLYFDILFTPSGQVMYNPRGLICLWVRDAEKVTHPRLDAGNNADVRSIFDDAGEQVLVAIYTRTGFIATHPVVAPPAAPTLGYDPYKNAKDGVNSGF